MGRCVRGGGQGIKSSCSDKGGGIGDEGGGGGVGVGVTCKHRPEVQATIGTFCAARPPARVNLFCFCPCTCAGTGTAARVGPPALFGASCATVVSPREAAFSCAVPASVNSSKQSSQNGRSVRSLFCPQRTVPMHSRWCARLHPPQHKSGPTTPHPSTSHTTGPPGRWAWDVTSP